MSKTVYDSIGSALMLYKNSPDSYNHYSGYLNFTKSDGNIVVIPFEMSERLSGRKIISATLEYYTYWYSDLSIELYSGNSWPLSYNELKSKCTKHSWSGNTTQITHENGAQRWAKVTLTGYASGLEKAFASGSYIFIVLIPDSSEQLRINSDYPASLTVNCENLDPKVYDLSPNDKAYVNKAISLSWYIDADEAYQTSYELGWSSDGGNTWNGISKESKRYNYDGVSFAAYTFPEGTIDWRVRITTNEGKKSAYAYASFECVKQIPSVSVNAPKDISIPNDRSYRFEWTYSGEDLGQKSYEIGWSSDSGATWNAVNIESSLNYHLYNAGEFPEGTIQWRVRVTNTDNYTSEYSYGEFTCIVKLPIVQIEFPNELKIPNSSEQIFTWIYSGNELAQIFYEIDWSSDEGNTWNNVSGVGEQLYHVFAVDTFPVGTIIWRIRVKNSENYFSEYAYGSFECVGRGEAPIVESISQNAIPKITWSAEHQVAFEIQIKKTDTVIFSSGFIGGENKEYQPNVLLSNGNYIVQVRILNMYGYISEWGTAAFVLEAEIPASTAEIKMSKVDAFGVSFECWNITGTGYIVRVEGDKETIIAKYEGKEIVDYHTRNEQTYTYILREHIDGYRDVKKVVFEPDFIGVLLHDISNYEDFVNIKWNESDYVEENDILTKNTVYHNCSGRIYPVKETNEQKTDVVTVTGFLNHEDRDKLREYYEKDKIVFLRSKNYCFAADISSFKDNRYHDKGYLVQISLTRIADKQEVSIL